MVSWIGNSEAQAAAAEKMIRDFPGTPCWRKTHRRDMRPGRALTSYPLCPENGAALRGAGSVFSGPTDPFRPQFVRRDGLIDPRTNGIILICRAMRVLLCRSEFRTERLLLPAGRG